MTTLGRLIAAQRYAGEDDASYFARRAIAKEAAKDSTQVPAALRWLAHCLSITVWF